MAYNTDLPERGQKAATHKKVTPDSDPPKMKRRKKKVKNIPTIMNPKGY